MASEHKRTFLSKLRKRFKNHWKTDDNVPNKRTVKIQTNLPEREVSVSINSPFKNVDCDQRNHKTCYCRENYRTFPTLRSQRVDAGRNWKSMNSGRAPLAKQEDLEEYERPLSCVTTVFNIEDPGYSTLDELEQKKNEKTTNDNTDDSGLESDGLSPHASKESPFSPDRVCYAEFPLKRKDSVRNSNIPPPIPPRNYTEDDRQYALSRREEKTHMSMKEVFEEAKLLGIKLKASKNSEGHHVQPPPRTSSLNRNFAPQNSKEEAKNRSSKCRCHSNARCDSYTSPNMHGRRLPTVPVETKSTETRPSATKVQPEAKTGMQLFMESMAKLREMGYYWGPLSAQEAECKLSDLSDGCFLVRDSSDERHLLSISFRSKGATHHTRIEHSGGLFHFKAQPKSMSAATIVEFIENAMEFSRNERFHFFVREQSTRLQRNDDEEEENPAPPVLVKLLTPVSRFFVVQSLKHLTRLKISDLVRKDHIELLPLPLALKSYLHEHTLCPER